MSLARWSWGAITHRLGATLRGAEMGSGPHPLSLNPEPLDRWIPRSEIWPRSLHSSRAFLNSR